MNYAMTGRLFAVFALALFSAPTAHLDAATAAQAPVSGALTLPRRDGSVRFAVMGDTGSGSPEQYEVAKHVYERIKPQKGGIVYWVSGSGGRLCKGDIRATDMIAKGFDSDYHFMIVEIAGDDLYFQAISRTGATVDSGVVHRPGAPAAGASIAPSPVPAPVAAAPVSPASLSTPSPAPPPR
jgi:hypothetical protein